MAAVQIMAGVAAIKGAKDLMEAARFVADFPNELNRFLGTAPAAPDPIVAALMTIQAALDALQDFALAQWVTEREDSLSLLRAHSSTALQTVNAFLQSGQSLTSPEWAPRLALADRDSLIAVNTFVDSMEAGFWLRPNSLAAISWLRDPDSFASGWMPHIPDRAEPFPINRVWDYRWANPAMLYAIACRIAVMRGISTPPDRFRAEVSRYNLFFARVFKKIESGVRAHRALTPEQFNRIPTHGMPMAVADIYGGYFVGGQFDPLFNDFNGPLYPPELPTLPFPKELLLHSAQTDIMLRNRSIVIDYFQAHVSISIGLSDLLMTAGTLERTCCYEPGTLALPRGRRSSPPRRAWGHRFHRLHGVTPWQAGTDGARCPGADGPFPPPQ